MTRDEQLAENKRRALQELNLGNLPGAVASMISDMQKMEDSNPESIKMIGMIGIFEIRNGTDSVRRWIEGFN
jgi:hypothetical protein